MIGHLHISLCFMFIEVLSLFSAIIKWLDRCIPFMSQTASQPSEDSASKHSLYVELASCLLSYINDVLHITKGRYVGIREHMCTVFAVMKIFKFWRFLKNKVDHYMTSTDYL